MKPPRVRGPRDSRPKFAPRRNAPPPLRSRRPSLGGIEAAPGSASRRARRTVQIPAFGIEAAAAVSAAHIPRRRRTAQIRIPSRRLAKTVRPPHPVTNPVVSPVKGAHSSFPDLDSNKRGSNSDDSLQLRRPCHNYWRDLGDLARSSPQDLGVDDHHHSDDKVLQPLPPHNRGDAGLDDYSDKKLQPLLWRDWSGLGDGPAGLIAERVLAYDVADYVRFRTVCWPWRQSSTEPRTHGGLDRRFHPWRWTMLREEHAVLNRRSFLNTSTAECVQVDIPELHDHMLLAITPEGLLVLVHKRQRTTVCLLNPLTRHLTELPPLTTLLPPKHHDMLLENNIYFSRQFQAWGSGIANDDSTFAVCFDKLGIIGMAKPGDDSWNFLEYRCDGMPTAPLMFAGRLYCVNLSGVMVLEMGADQPPQLKVAAKLSKHVSPMADSLHLVNNCGELILVHRWSGQLTRQNKSGRFYTAYRVDLDTQTLFRVKSLGGAAVFMGLYCSLSVPSEVFPSGSISADSIYPSFDLRERTSLKAGAYHLAGGRVELPCNLVARPHTLVDCLSLSNTVNY